MKRWLACMEAHYRVDNAYHNATHAADVLQATSFFLNSPNVAKHVNETHAVAALIAAAIHDLDHPGPSLPHSCQHEKEETVCVNARHAFQQRPFVFLLERPHCLVEFIQASGNSIFFETARPPCP